MSAVTFDTLELTDLLRTSGIEQKQAEAIVKTIAKAQDGLVTKEYLDYKFEKELAPIRTDLVLLKWMMGLLLGGVLSIVVKTYF
ncbi:MAG: DUF1640 domain-containing protein [Methylococcales bacterium]|nr:DUF1640 domain-containing protein [Methylococcales bacterium]MDD5216443.1 DUF1640 domain-containing protein [Methylococcales bacterium]